MKVGVLKGVRMIQSGWASEMGNIVDQKPDDLSLCTLCHQLDVRLRGLEKVI